MGKVITIIFVLLLINGHANALDSSVRRQVVDSPAFKEFIRERFAELRAQTDNNPEVQCLYDEYNRLIGAKPDQADYIKERREEYSRYASRGFGNETEACIEHHYTSTRCSPSGSSGLKCGNQEFTPKAEGVTGQTPPKAVDDSSKNSIKNIIKRIREADRIKREARKKAGMN